MKKTIIILAMVIMAAACYSQNNAMDYTNEAAPALEDYLYLIKGGTTDRNTSKLQFQQNLFDSLGVVRGVIALQQIEVDNNNDSIVGNEARIEANEMQIATNGTNISGNSISIGLIETDVDLKLAITDTSDMLAVYARDVDVALKLNISDTSDMLASYSSRLAAYSSRLETLEALAVTWLSNDTIYVRNATDTLYVVGTEYVPPTDTPNADKSQFDVYYDVGFEDHGLNVVYGETMLESDFGGTPSTTFTDSLLLFGSDTVFKMTVDKGDEQGDNWDNILSPDTITSFLISMNISFKPGFEFGDEPSIDGGKFIGPAGRGHSDITYPAGGVTVTDAMGFSARQRFQSGYPADSLLGAYVYHHGITGGPPSYGDAWVESTQREYDDTIVHNVAQHLVMNTLVSEGTANSDGIWEYLVNGIVVASRTNVVFRKYSDVDFDVLIFRFLFGGSGVASRDEWLAVFDIFIGEFGATHDHAARTAIGLGDTIVMPNYPLQIHSDYPPSFR